MSSERNKADRKGEYCQMTWMSPCTCTEILGAMWRCTWWPWWVQQSHGWCRGVNIQRLYERM